MDSPITQEVANGVTTVLLDGLWGAPWRLRGMEKSLRKRGFSSVERFGYDSRGYLPLEELAEKFVEFAGTNPIRVVAHSMGGILIRVAKWKYPQLQLQKAAFLCVPHHGSVLANFVPFHGVRQLRPGSGLLRALAEQPWEIPTLSVWCPGDLMVFPGSSARWEKSTRELRCDLPLHNWPVISPGIHNRIADFFSEP